MRDMIEADIKNGKMNKDIILSDLVDALEMQSNEITYYFNKKEQTLVFVMDDAYCDEEENRKLLKDIENNSKNYIALPTEYEINEYAIMEAFVAEQQVEVKNSLTKILNAKRAFRKFQDKVFELDIRDEWFEFRKDRLEKIAVEWCENNSVFCH